MDLQGFPMSDQMRLALLNNNLSFVEEIVLISPQELSKKLGIKLDYCLEFLKMARLAIIPRPIENSSQETLLTGLQSLDDLGGISKGQLFEVFGEAGGDLSD